MVYYHAPSYNLGMFLSHLTIRNESPHSYTETSIIPRLTEQPRYFNDFLR